LKDLTGQQSAAVERVYQNWFPVSAQFTALIKFSNLKKYCDDDDVQLN